MIAVVMTCICACNGKSESKAEKQTEVSKPVAEEVVQEEGDEVPAVMAEHINGMPLFAPFNEGDITNGGRVLKQSPEKYTKFILGDAVFDVSYKEEKNKQLEHDNSYLNQYIYKSKDEMKGQLFSFADAKAVERYMQTHGDMTAEGEIIPQEYKEGILVPAEYLQNRSVMKFRDTITEDPEEPQFPAEVIAAVEKMLGAKVERNRVATIFGEDEYKFGVMRTKPNEKYGIAAWVLAKGNDVSIWTDTCEVVPEEGRVYWSSYDPDEYMEPHTLAVVKGDKGLDIYVFHMSTDETTNFYLMRQEGPKLRQIGMGGFYQMYE